MGVPSAALAPRAACPISRPARSSSSSSGGWACCSRRVALAAAPPPPLARRRRQPRELPAPPRAQQQDQQQQPEQQQPLQQRPAEQPPAPPPAAFTQQYAGARSHTQDLYSSSAQPIARFGFASGFADKYELAAQLGSGTFGIVHVAVSRETGEWFAVKSMPKRWAAGGHLEPYYVRRVRNEVDICNHLGR